MRREEFRIGLEFWCGGKRWRCTALGSRVVVAVCLDPSDPVEQIFHQYDLPACSLSGPDSDSSQTGG